MERTIKDRFQNKSLKILFAILFIPLLAICQPGDHSFKPRYSSILDTSKGNIFIRQLPRALPGKISGFWNVTDNDQQKLQKHFKKLLGVSAIGSLEGFKLPIGLDRYAFQYLGVIINRKRYIYINAFYLSDMISIEDYRSWQTDPITWKNGSYSFWGALFNVRKGEFSDLVFNAP